MELKKGDIVAVTVSRAWTEAMGDQPSLHFFTGNDTETARTFAAKIVSVTHTDGLWLSTAKEGEKKPQSEGKILVPWVYIFAVRTGEAMMADRHKFGF
jgi:hypothetical protein